MNRSKKTKNGAPDPMPETVREPAGLPPKKRAGIIVFLLTVSASLIFLVYGLYGLTTGSLFTIDRITLMYGKFLAARSENAVFGLIFLCLALILLIYCVYGLRKGGVRNIIPAKFGRDSTYYQGLPMGVMLLSYLSLSVYLITSAVVLVYNNKPLHRDMWKWEGINNVPLFLSVGLLFIAGWLDSAIGGRDMQEVLASVRERFGKDSVGKKALLDNGITYDRKTFFEYIAEEDIANVKLFLEVGMNVDGVDPLEINTPLSAAARNGNKELVKLFLEKKADSNKAAKRGLPPLWSTVYDFENTAILRLLIKHNADVDARNADGETVLMRAAAALSLDTVKFLLENKADINAQTKDGHTALLYAVERTGYETVDDKQVVEKDSFTMVKYLLEQGADPNVKPTKSGSKNNTPLRIARSSRKVKEVVALLEQYHAKE